MKIPYKLPNLRDNGLSPLEYCAWNVKNQPSCLLSGCVNPAVAYDPRPTVDPSTGDRVEVSFPIVPKQNL